MGILLEREKSIFDKGLWIDSEINEQEQSMNKLRARKESRAWDSACEWKGQIHLGRGKYEERDLMSDTTLCVVAYLRL